VSYLIHIKVTRTFLIRTVCCLAALINGYGCSTDFDVIDNWRETTVVYGLLDQSQSVQYVKVTKAFLGEGDALMMAQNFDSLYYDTNDIVVTLTEVETGVTWTLDPDMSIPLEPGTFATQQVIYKVAMTPDEDYRYQLKVKNVRSGTETVATTRIVKRFSVTNPGSNSYQVDFHPTLVNPTYKVKWNAAVNGKRFNLILRTHFHRKNELTQVIDTFHVDYNFGEFKTTKLDGTELMEASMQKNDYYSFLANNIDADLTYEYHPKYVEFLFAVAGDELNTYMEVSAPSTGIVQEKPSYTNLANGIGIFSSRLNQNATSSAGFGNPPLNPYAPYGFLMSKATLDSLCAGQFTKNHNFCDPAAFVPTDPCFCD
jgi:hypothetical protein